MQYDVILVTGEEYFDHPLCGTAIMKRLLEKYGYEVAIIELPTKEEDMMEYGEPKLFFGISSGSVDTMVKNYTPMKKHRGEDKHLKRDHDRYAPDRAVTVYSNWIKSKYKESKIIIGGTESSLRRFVHFDYWQNRLRNPIIFDARADILVYGNGEKPILEISNRLKTGKDLVGIKGTCIISKEIPEGFIELPSAEEVKADKEKFCDQQNLISNKKNLAQKIDTRYCLQYESPIYTPADLDEYYELPFSRQSPKELRGFEFSVITHRGCIGRCNFCALTLLQGDRIVSRSEESIIREIKYITTLAHFKGNIDDVGGPSANMYGIDCNDCNAVCLKCPKLITDNRRMIDLLKRARSVNGVKNVYIKSGIRYDLANEEYIKEVAEHHIFDTLRVAPEHVVPEVIKLMGKDEGDLEMFKTQFHKYAKGKKLAYYYMTAHPGSTQKEADELGRVIKKERNTESVQVFTPTPMTASTCMYYTEMDPKTKKKVYVPHTYNEKKMQKRACMEEDEIMSGSNDTSWHYKPKR